MAMAILEKSLIWPFTLNSVIRLFWRLVGPEFFDGKLGGLTSTLVIGAPIFSPKPVIQALKLN